MLEKVINQWSSSNAIFSAFIILGVDTEFCINQLVSKNVRMKRTKKRYSEEIISLTEKLALFSLLGNHWLFIAVYNCVINILVSLFLETSYPFYDTQ